MKKIIIMSLLGTIFGLFSCNAQSEKSGSDNGFKSVEVEEFAKVIADTAVVRLDYIPHPYMEDVQKRSRSSFQRKIQIVQLLLDKTWVTSHRHLP